MEIVQQKAAERAIPLHGKFGALDHGRSHSE